MNENDVMFEEYEIDSSYLEEIIPFALGLGCGQGCIGINCSQ